MYRYAIFLTLIFFAVASQGRTLFAEATPPDNSSLRTAIEADSDSSPANEDAGDTDVMSTLSPSEKATIQDMIQESHGEPQRSPAIVDSSE